MQIFQKPEETEPTQSSDCVTKREAVAVSLEEIYCEHRQGLYTFALSVAGSAALAEDAIQMTFEKLLRAEQLRKSTPAVDPVAYTFRAVRNTVLDLCRSDQRHKKLQESVFEFVDDRDSVTPDSSLMDQERCQIVQAAIDRLGDSEREVVMLKSFGGLTFRQIGEVLETSPKTLATRYQRALEKLENFLRGKL